MQLIILIKENVVVLEMSNTKKQLILSAYGMIGYTDVMYNNDAEQIEIAFDILNDMISAWESSGVNIGFNFNDDVASESNIPSYANMAVKFNLALLLAGSLGKQPTNDLMINAQRSYDNLKLKFYEIPILKANTTIYGQGMRATTLNALNFKRV